MTFNAFYGAQKKNALSYLIGKGMDPADAEDVFEESIVAFWEKEQDAEARSYGKQDAAYLFAICRNQGNHKFCDISKHTTYDLDEFVHGIKDEDLEDGIYSYFSDEAEEDERWPLVEAAMSQLCKSDQRLLNLYFYKGLSMAEIATEMGYKNENTVKSQKCRIMRQLKDMIDRQQYRIAA